MMGKVMSTDTLDIVFASDNHYIKYTAVTLASLLKNVRDKTKPIRVFVLLEEALDHETVEKIEQLKKIHDFSFYQVQVDASQFENVKTTDGITIATYFRLFMHKLLPEDCHYVIYLDSDLIIKHSIDELLGYADKDVLFWGVQDSISRVYNRRFGLLESEHHVNAGVLLVNINLMRSLDFDSKIKEFLDINQYRILLGDQQIIAEVFNHLMRYLPVKWNVHGSMFQKGWVEEHVGVSNSFKLAEAREAVHDPAIIHYTLARKPWISMEHPCSATWYEYLELTAFKQDIVRPNRKPKKRKSVDASSSGFMRKKVVKKRKVTIRRLMSTLIPAYFKSVKELRSTRLEVERIKQKIEHDVQGAAGDMQSSVVGSMIDYKLINTTMAASRPKHFSAQHLLQELGEHASILSNVKADDIDGGYAENIKSIFKTAHFGFKPDKPSDAVVFLSQRLKQDMFWACLTHGYLREKPVYFAEVALFGGFAGFFDQQATLQEKKALGFLLDDMGYYFDSNQSSRFEHTLNSDDYFLEDHDLLRSRMLIEEINQFNITKYNKYVSDVECAYHIEENCILVVDQKKGDASITFAGASDATFLEMMQAAIKDNPGKQIYFKRHPDSVHKNFNSYRNRNLKEIEVLPDDIQIAHVLKKCEKVYTVSSQVGFEGLLKGKQVVCFGVPFYAGWGLTDDRAFVPRRNKKRKLEEIFHQVCIKQSVYFNPYTGRVVSLEELLTLILKMRAEAAARSKTNGD